MHSTVPHCPVLCAAFSSKHMTRRKQKIDLIDTGNAQVRHACTEAAQLCMGVRKVATPSGGEATGALEVVVPQQASAPELPEAEQPP